MMDRRSFLRRSALVAAGVVAADQLEIVERLGWVRRLFPSAAIRPTLYGDGVHDDTRALQALVDGKEVYDIKRHRILAGTRGQITIFAGDSYRLTETIAFGRGSRLVRV